MNTIIIEQRLHNSAIEAYRALPEHEAVNTATASIRANMVLSQVKLFAFSLRPIDIDGWKPSFRAPSWLTSNLEGKGPADAVLSLGTGKKLAAATRNERPYKVLSTALATLHFALHAISTLAFVGLGVKAVGSTGALLFAPISLAGRVCIRTAWRIATLPRFAYNRPFTALALTAIGAGIYNYSNELDPRNWFAGQQEPADA